MQLLYSTKYLPNLEKINNKTNKKKSLLNLHNVYSIMIKIIKFNRERTREYSEIGVDIISSKY